ncbi:MAG: TetR/AcrR family transcriptional regulator [Candidatus Microthrix subdominans]|jgi:AcrR family transcriptional regulator|uniref:TetR/AcrR family transcriptional regulator n=1 Tax=Candidatus Neomicrothrix sp. TaxID=2719034 RepID=UPI002591F0FB|nr:TetR/AcrR family transcriptional regulator [Candidatus Microthrix sp.]MBK6969985.1 TetR/AcrR family transcriptional regulator [Candidatus Microthrix sp.]MBK7166026.1 TetR/AcrR family transcriptional regulator [Candidatus Microthrix sp.]HMS47112.1 TetR/AcrR family transcriptional regulator [Candidatus Microthrix sp.]
MADDESASVPLGKGEQTRLDILHAAIARFGRDGFRGTSVADIARDAGVSGTAAYAYFDNKKALFLAALDEDAASAISEGMAIVFDESVGHRWRQGLLVSLVEAVSRHPLARRVLANHEPDVLDRVVDLPALAELRKAVAARLTAEQFDGQIRADIDPAVVGAGIVSIILSLLMTLTQLGEHAPTDQAADVVAVFEAALDPPR